MGLVHQNSEETKQTAGLLFCGRGSSWSRWAEGFSCGHHGGEGPGGPQVSPTLLWPLCLYVKLQIKFRARDGRLAIP